LPVDVRVNTVNCKGVMGAGVAFAFKNRYPDMFKEYKKACKAGIVKPGVMHVWKNLLGDWVINFPTKRDWREPSRYDDILSGLDSLRDYLKEFGSISVALPALGCGHGGLDWKRVSTMIKEKLSDLDAHIFVFEPTDSRNAERVVKDQFSSEHIRELEDLGFKAIDLMLQHDGKDLPSTILAKGSEAVLTHSWIALLPSKAPSEKELSALEAVARQMAREAKPMVVAMVYATRATERISEIFLKHGIAVVLILPFGPLTRKPVARTPTSKWPGLFTILSVAAPNAAWGWPVLAQSMTLLRAKASSTLLSDPAPDWLKGKTMHTWAKQSMFYLRYEAQHEDERRMLDREGARPIGRRSDTGEPNLTPLLYVDNTTKRAVEENTAQGEDHFTFSLNATSASHFLRKFATAIERSPQPNGTVHITVPRGPGTKGLCADFSSILRGDVEKN